MSNVKASVVRVGEAKFRWSVLHEQTWARDRHDLAVVVGLAILVEPPEPSRRELLLQFDVDRSRGKSSRHRNMPERQRFRIHEGRLVEAIRSAMLAGWDPNSRGKRFVFQAGVLQPR